jgi:pimeloyl-ACP methyl ester carboxylesterase
MKLYNKIILLFISTLVSYSQIFAGPIDFYKQNQLKKKRENSALITTRQYYFKQIIDHQKPDKGTYRQRYFIDETYGPKATSPVFFYICGEGVCGKDDLDGAIRYYAKKFHAKLVALEHRYYGKSIPLPTLASKDLQYLTTELALADLANFQTTISKKRHWTGAWVAFGGSYPGSLAAYYRLKYPELVVGALASSAPVMAKEDFFEYDGHVAKVAGPQCLSLMKGVVSEIEDSISNKRKFNKIKAIFNAQDVENSLDFVYLVADVAAEAIQYGKRDKFCNLLENSPTAIEGYASYAKELFEELETDAVGFTPQGWMSESPKDYDSDIGVRQWYYQSCTEYGYWQNANPSSDKSARSSLINLDYHHEVCKRLFNIETPANVDLINKSFYYPLLDESVSNIYFTNGDQDPWSVLSLIDANSNTNNANLSYYLIEGASHCVDLSEPKKSDTKSLSLARAKMERLLREWL